MKHCFSKFIGDLLVSMIVIEQHNISGCLVPRYTVRIEENSVYYTLNYDRAKAFYDNIQTREDVFDRRDKASV